MQKDDEKREIQQIQAHYRSTGQRETPNPRRAKKAKNEKEQVARGFFFFFPFLLIFVNLTK